MKLQGFSPKDIIVHPELRARKGPPSPENIQRLAESIAQDGQESPGIVREDDKGKFHLVAGENRLEAVRLLNESMGKDEKPLQFFATVIKADEKLSVIRAGIENEVRIASDVFDRAALVQRLMDLGMSQADIAKRFNWSEATVTQTIRIGKLPRKLQKMVQDGDLEQDAALELVADSDKLDKVQMEEVIEEAIRHRNAYEAIKNRKAKEAEAAAKAAAAAAAQEKDPEKKKAADEKAKVATKKAGTAKKSASKTSKVSKEDVQVAKDRKGVTGEPTPRSRKAFFVALEAIGSDKESPMPKSARELMGRIEGFLDGDYSETQLRNSFLKNCIPD